MGNSLACFSPITRTSNKAEAAAAESNSPPPPAKEILPPWLSPSAALRKSRKLLYSPSSKKSYSSREEEHQLVYDDSYIKQQAQIASMLYQHHLMQNNGGDLLLNLDRSVSSKNPTGGPKKLSRRSRSLSSSTASLSSLHLPNQDVITRSDDCKHFVLVHGGGFGAWCWYKIIALLKESKFEVDALDLSGSGSNFCDTNSITSLSQYSAPLTQFLANLDKGKKVILVGHDIGGACISYAMEMFPSKVSMAIFVAATMLTNDQSALDVFSQQVCTILSLSPF
ncbi:PREDICTED: putative methylesterase 11, chloroplastic [Erythranthe guttata]|uniref:putative methylesterase 11, chloroplastic n=1 Tax=Erythranthe guttata TaxID=4155 RepID=UPI00064DF8BC|nr:PREDICTED: putative methylesterase 11, chloroplastic [Erythranthe guttata]|eukprot:XP_012847636.1 PREDICTED: putative methylesterase 11, chloroplastic [Erythranthe guttata]